MSSFYCLHNVARLVFLKCSSDHVILHRSLSRNSVHWIQIILNIWDMSYSSGLISTFPLTILCWIQNWSMKLLFVSSTLQWLCLFSSLSRLLFPHLYYWNPLNLGRLFSNSTFLRFFLISSLLHSLLALNHLLLSSSSTSLTRIGPGLHLGCLSLLSNWKLLVYFLCYRWNAQ